MRDVSDRYRDEGELIVRDRAAPMQASVLVMSAGIVLLLVGVGPRVAPSATSTLLWLSTIGGGLLVLVGLFTLGNALGRSVDKSTCPHCNKPVPVGDHGRGLPPNPQ